MSDIPAFKKTNTKIQLPYLTAYKMQGSIRCTPISQGQIKKKLSISKIISK